MNNKKILIAGLIASLCAGVVIPINATPEPTVNTLTLATPTTLSASILPPEPQSLAQTSMPTLLTNQTQLQQPEQITDELRMQVELYPKSLEMQLGAGF